MATLPRNIFETYDPVLIGDWGCKASKYANQVMVFMWHIYNLDSQLEWFDSESYAKMRR